MEYKQLAVYETPCAEAVELVMESAVNNTGNPGGHGNDMPIIDD